MCLDHWVVCHVLIKHAKIFSDKSRTIKGEIVSWGYLGNVVALILSDMEACKMKTMQKSKILISITFLQK